MHHRLIGRKCIAKENGGRQIACALAFQVEEMVIEILILNQILINEQCKLNSAAISVETRTMSLAFEIFSVKKNNGAHICSVIGPNHDGSRKSNVSP